MNLAGEAGLKASDLQIVIVLHGDATAASLDEHTYNEKYGKPNEHLDLIDRLKKAGIRIFVCGQALNRKQFHPNSISPQITVARSAITAVVNFQSRGFAYIPSH